MKLPSEKPPARQMRYFCIPSRVLHKTFPLQYQMILKLKVGKQFPTLGPQKKVSLSLNIGRSGSALEVRCTQRGRFFHYKWKYIEGPSGSEFRDN